MLCLEKFTNFFIENIIQYQKRGSGELKMDHSNANFGSIMRIKCGQVKFAIRLLYLEMRKSYIF